MTSQEYWKKREDEALKHYITDEVEYKKHIDGIYDYLLDQIEKEINGFYTKYANAEGITMAEAKKRVSKLDIEAYSRKAEKYVKNKDFSSQANAEMRLYNATMKINRLEMLKANIGLEMVDSFDELQKYFDGILTQRTLDEFERQAGILGESIKDNAKAAHSIVNASFNNATFSDRIWMYQDMLKNELSSLLQEGLIQGKHPNVLAKHLQKRFGVQKSYAERLMRTELARVQIEAQKESYENGGYEQYMFIATHSIRTCPVCAALDGKVFYIKSMVPATNAPPMHPNCRCSTVAYMDREEGEKELEISSGKSVELPQELKLSTKLPEDIKTMISDTIDNISKQYNVDMSNLEFAPYYDNPSAPFTFIPYEEKGQYRAKLNINELFDWNSSLASFNERVYNKNYKKGMLASQNAEDLIYHEAAHFITFRDCYTYYDFVRKEREVRQKFIAGVSGYSDATMDGAETIAEAFVRRKNGESLSDKVLKLLEEYIKEP